MPPVGANDPERKVTAGRRFVPPAAAAWNMLIDAAKRHKRERFRQGPRDALTSTVAPANTILLQNKVATLDHSYSVLRVGNAMLTPEGTGENMGERVGFEGLSPTSDGAVAVLESPAGFDDVVRAVVSGVTPCWVVFGDPSHQWANPVGGVTTHLQSDTSGVARVLWSGDADAPPVEGAKLALVNLIGAAGSAPSPPEACTPAAESGVSIQGTGGVWTSVTPAHPLRLPAAGNYLVTWSVSADGNIDGVGTPSAHSQGAYVTVRLYDCTNGASLGGSCWLGDGRVAVHAFPVPDYNPTFPDRQPLFSGGASESLIVAADGPTDLDLQARVVETFGQSFFVATVRGVKWAYVRVGDPPSGGCEGSGCGGSGSGGSPPPPPPPPPPAIDPNCGGSCDGYTGDYCLTVTNKTGVCTTWPDTLTASYNTVLVDGWAVTSGDLGLGGVDLLGIVCQAGIGWTAQRSSGWGVTSLSCSSAPNPVVYDIAFDGDFGAGSCTMTWTRGACP